MLGEFQEKAEDYLAFIYTSQYPLAFQRVEHATEAMNFVFVKGQGHQCIFSLVKGTLWGNCKFLREHFKGTKGDGGNPIGCLREVSDLCFGTRHHGNYCACCVLFQSLLDVFTHLLCTLINFHRSSVSFRMSGLVLQHQRARRLQISWVSCK